VALDHCEAEGSKLSLFRLRRALRGRYAREENEGRGHVQTSKRLSGAAPQWTPLFRLSRDGRRLADLWDQSHENLKRRGAMRLELTDEETATLRAMLHDYLPDLRREVAATDGREMRHELAKRQDLCELLLTRLGEPVS
jgi:hypothetical protein